MNTLNQDSPKNSSLWSNYTSFVFFFLLSVFLNLYLVYGYVLLRGRGPNNIGPTGYRADYTVVKLLQHISELCLLVKLKCNCTENATNSCGQGHDMHEKQEFMQFCSFW